MLLKEDEQTQVFNYLLLRDTSLGGICKANNKPKTKAWSLWRESSHEDQNCEKVLFLAVEDDHLAISVSVGPLLFVCIQFGKMGTCLQLLHLIEFASSYRISCC
jgi:hypothetical protein